MTETMSRNENMDSNDQAFVITRVFDAPRELIWRAFTEAEHMQRWWGPKGFACTVKKMDLRPGGVFHYRMRSAGGNEMWGRFTYGEIEAPGRIEFINSFSDEQGNICPAPFDMDWPLEVRNEMTLVEENGKTTLTLRGGPINATEAQKQTYLGMFDSMRAGFGGTFAQLDGYLAELRASERELVLERVIDAPREAIYKAWTDPEQLKKWWGPRMMTTPFCDIDLRPGGVFRTLMRAPDGTEYPTKGVFLEIEEPSKLVFTDAYDEGWTPVENPFFTCVLTLDEQDGKTLFRARALHWTVENRQKHEEMGFHQGWGESLDRLVELVAGA